MKTEHYSLDGEDLCIPVAESYRDCIQLIKSDQFRIYGRIKSTLSILFRGILPFSENILFWLRMSSYKGILYPFCILMYRIVSKRALVQIPPLTKIGYGFYTGHNICIVINPGTIIGNNVNISQFLNIGTNHNTPAIIGNNVYIGPHVCIIENVEIANNSTIGAEAVVTKNVPENATVAGVPAKILNYNNPGRYIKKSFNIDKA